VIAVERSELNRCRAVTCEAPLIDPLALIEAFEGWPIAAMESPSGDFVVGIGEAYAIEAHGADRFESIRMQAARTFSLISHRGRPLRMFGGFAFEETDARFVLPRWIYETSGTGARLTLTLRGDEDPKQFEAERARMLRAFETPPAIASVPAVNDVARPGDYAKTVARALEDIGSGALEKVVLARRIRVEADQRYRIAPVLSAFGRSEGAVRFAFGRSGGFFAGATPELLVSRTGSEIRSEAVAGSVSPEHSARLLDSAKDRAEHGHVARFVKTTLERFSREVMVGEHTPSRLAHVAHLRAPITGRLSRPTHVLEVAHALHPTPAVGGVPRKAACDLIRELEGQPRGWYAGAIGWFDSEGDGELYVALRSARFEDRIAELVVGAGIVAGSDPEAEARETELKAKTVATALGATA
jgi:menaquinone-specific isochorismate synthase